MAEFPRTRDGVLLNGEPINGRTYKNEDGTYRSFDLCEAEVGSVVTVETKDGTFGLTKEEADSALEGWSYVNQETLARTALSLCLFDGEGFRTPRVVLTKKLGLGVVHLNDPKRPTNMINMLGPISEIRYATPEEAEAARLVDAAFEEGTRSTDEVLVK